MASSSFDINPIESFCSVLPKLCIYTAHKVPLNYKVYNTVHTCSFVHIISIVKTSHIWSCCLGNVY